MRLRPVDFLGRVILCAGTLINPDNSTTNAQEPGAPQSTEKISKAAKTLFTFERTDSQINGNWIITYTIEYLGKENPESKEKEETDIIISPSCVDMEYSGKNLSNSRAPSHGIPKTNNAKWSLAKENPVVTTIIKSDDDKQKCRENISLYLASPGMFDIAFDQILKQLSENKSIVSIVRSQEPFTVKPKGKFKVCTIIQHDHFLHGTYDPLFGERNFQITIPILNNQATPIAVNDTVILNQELLGANVIPKLNTPPVERMFNTDDYEEYRKDGLAGRKGNFLFLDAEIPGFQYFRFDDMHIRAGDTFELSFDYYIAVGTETSCKARIMEYQNSPDTWRRLDDGGFDAHLGYGNTFYLEGIEDAKIADKIKQALTSFPYILVFEKPKPETQRNDGSWQHFKFRFKTLNNATTIAFDPRLVGSNIGTMWLDKIKLVCLNTDKYEGRKEKYKPKSTEVVPLYITSP